MRNAKSNKIEGLRIRDTRIEELDRVSVLLEDAFGQYQKEMPRESWAGYRDNIIDVRSRLTEASLIVAELNGELAGAVTLYLDGSIEGWPEHWAGIRLLGVHPKFRHLGIGRALMEECIQRSRQRSVRTIGLHTSQMMGIAKHMYENMGFLRAPEFDFHPTPEVTVTAYRLDI